MVFSYNSFAKTYGLGADASSLPPSIYDQWSTTQLKAQWEAGMSSVPYATAVKMRAAAQDAIQSEKFDFGPTAQANLTKWDQYVTNLNTKIAMTPAAYVASGGRAGVIGSNAGVAPTGGIFSSLLSALGVTKNTPVVGGLVSGPAPTPVGGQATASASGGSSTLLLVGLAGVGLFLLMPKKKQKRFMNPVKKTVKLPFKILKRVVR